MSLKTWPAGSRSPEPEPKPEGMSQSEFYIAGGGNLAANPRVAAILALADESHHRRNQPLRRETPEEYEARHAKDKENRAGFLTHCRPATIDDYRAWARVHIAAGGRFSHTYDYPFGRGGDWHVLTTELGAKETMPSLYGALAINVIVPAGMRLNVPATFHGECGHSHVYFMDPAGPVPSWVPAYTDVP